jgi:hypothetical protein
LETQLQDEGHQRLEEKKHAGIGEEEDGGGVRRLGRKDTRGLEGAAGLGRKKMGLGFAPFIPTW